MASRIRYNNSLRSDQELQERIDNRQNYMPETVEAAIAELQHRGHEFTDEELKIINEDLQAQHENAALVSNNLGIFNNDYKNVIINDPDAPQMYSRRSLYLFTVFMGALFGSIMLAINISKTENKNGAIWVMLFGIGFTAIQVFITTHLDPNSGSSGYSIIFGVVAAYCLDFFFWKPFIGYYAFYRARAIWVPLIIAVVIMSLIILAVFHGGTQ